MLELVADDFVAGWDNNYREDHVGYSSGYSPKQAAVGTTNGAGGHNLQIFVLSSDGVVLHALPGFWHPEDLARELRFAKLVHALWQDDGRSRAQKERMYRLLHESEIRRRAPATIARSQWQPFDAHTEWQKLEADPTRDTALTDAQGRRVVDAAGRPKLVALDLLARRRMMARPFVPFPDFDVESFVDYGQYHYDLNRGIDGRGKPMPGQDRLRSRRALEAARAEREAARSASRR